MSESKWHLLSEGPPDQYGDFLASNGFDVQMVHYLNGDVWYFSFDKETPLPRGWGMTHWCELPIAPKLIDMKKED